MLFVFGKTTWAELNTPVPVQLVRRNRSYEIAYLSIDWRSSKMLNSIQDELEALAVLQQSLLDLVGRPGGLAGLVDPSQDSIPCSRAIQNQ